MLELEPELVENHSETMSIPAEKLLEKFEFSRILKEDNSIKSIILLGLIEGQPAIVTLERLPFKENELDQMVDLGKIDFAEKNDIYQWMRCGSKDLPNKLNLIWPATPKHIAKYGTLKAHLITETPEMYENITKPYIETQRGDRIQWVNNILFHGKEAESVIYRDDDPQSGFVLLPDLKWDGQTQSTFYSVCIVNRQDISCLRDLNLSHIDWLTQVRSTIRSMVYKIFGIPSDELRLFVHYQPSYYHFHIHVVAITNSNLGLGFSATKAVLLDEIIDNLKFLGSEGYLKRTLTYALNEQSDLWKIFNEANNDLK